MLKLFIITFCISTFAFAESKQDIHSFLSEKFGEKISKAIAAKTQSEIEGVLGRPSLVEKSHIYYELEGFKYALSASIKQGKVEGLFYHPKNIVLSLKDFEEKKLIDIKKMRPVKKNGINDGLSQEYIDKEAKIRLVFRTSNDHSLKTVEILK